MQNINYSSVMYRTVKIGEVSYRYEDTCSIDDIIKMMVAAARKLSQYVLSTQTRNPCISNTSDKGSEMSVCPISSCSRPH